MKKWIYIFLSLLMYCSSIASVNAFDEHTFNQEWKKNDTGWWYVNEDESYPVNQWQKIDGFWYHFDTKGYMQTGWYKEGNIWYYLNPSGAMATGWKKINNIWYFFNNSGSMATGWKYISDKWYYLDPVNGDMKTGWQKLNKKWYFFNNSGSMATGWKYISGKWYYLDPINGDMKTGWLYLDKTYYLSSSGAMLTGIQTIDGIQYNFDSSGVLTGKVEEGEWVKKNNQWYYITDGVYAKYWKKIDGKWYYFNANGVMQTGWRYISGKWYFLESSGAMKTGWLKDKQFWYYLDSSGAMVSGKTLTINGKTYEFLSNGVMYDKDLVISEANKLVGQTGECVRMAYELTKNSLGMGASTLIIEEDNSCGKAHQVSEKEARAGDLIIFRGKPDTDVSGVIPHVGVYLDGYTSFHGNWLQKDGSRKAVITDYRNSSFYPKNNPDYDIEFWRIDSVYPDYVFTEDE